MTPLFTNLLAGQLVPIDAAPCGGGGSGVGDDRRGAGEGPKGDDECPRGDGEERQADVDDATKGRTGSGTIYGDDGLVLIMWGYS